MIGCGLWLQSVSDRAKHRRENGTIHEDDQGIVHVESLNHHSSSATMDGTASARFTTLVDPSILQV